MSTFQYTRKKTDKLWPYVMLVAVPLAVIAVFFILRNNKEFCKAIISGFSRPVRSFLGDLCSGVPFSIAELLCILFGLWIILHLIRSVILLIKGKHKLRVLARRVLLFVAVPVYLFTTYCFLWSVCYFDDTFSAKSGMINSGVNSGALADTASYFAVQANQLSSQVPRDDNGHFNASIGELLDQSTAVYNNLFRDYGFLSSTLHEPKVLLSSQYLSRTGFTGIYFPFTGESNINSASPLCLLPYTIAHELAHQLGVASEDEACYVGIAACITSDNTVYAYSGYLDALIYLMNALYTTDRDAYYRIRETYTKDLLIDLADNNAYWSSQESTVTTLASSVYDGYLKSNGQASGLLSYGECVNLLVSRYTG